MQNLLQEGRRMKQKGFTLIELLIAIFGGVLLLGILLSMYISLYKIWDEYTLIKQINNNYMIIGERIAQQVISENCSYNEISTKGLPMGSEIKNTRLNIKGHTLAHITVATTNPVTQELYSFDRYYRIRGR